MRKTAGPRRYVLHFLIKEETGTDVTGSQTGCCDYNTMKMPACVMDTQRPKSRALASANQGVCESADWCEDGDLGKKLLRAIRLGQVADQSTRCFNWMINHCDGIYIFLERSRKFPFPNFSFLL